MNLAQRVAIYNFKLRQMELKNKLKWELKQVDKAFEEKEKISERILFFQLGGIGICMVIVILYSIAIFINF